MIYEDEKEQEAWLVRVSLPQGVSPGYAALWGGDMPDSGSWIGPDYTRIIDLQNNLGGEERLNFLPLKGCHLKTMSVVRAVAVRSRDTLRLVLYVPLSW